MSLFDVIRYPISDPPTAEELTALPTELYMKWMENAGWREPGCSAPIWYVVSFYPSFEFVHTDIILLRKMIKEYDEPV